MSDQHILAHFGPNAGRVKMKIPFINIQSKFTELHELASCHSTTNFTMYLRNLRPTLSIFKLELTFTGILASPQKFKKKNHFLDINKSSLQDFHHISPALEKQATKKPSASRRCGQTLDVTISEASKYLQ